MFPVSVCRYSLFTLYIRNFLHILLLEYMLQKASPQGKTTPCGLMCAPSGARFQQVQVLNPPGSGKDIAESKGVHREVESEGSWMWGTY